MLPTKENNPNGLHQRYIVSKTSGKPVDEDAEYFVLRVDKNGKDPKHIAACHKAVLKYAEEIADYLPELARDLYKRYGGDKVDYTQIYLGLLKESLEFMNKVPNNKYGNNYELCSKIDKFLNSTDGDNTK